MEVDARPAPRAQTRDRILDGLSRAVAVSGSDVTVRHVLEEAGVSRRTFYQYFDGLDAARVALHARIAATLSGVILQVVLSEPDPAERVRRAAFAYLDFQVQGGPTLYALQREAARPGSPLSETHDRVLDELVAFIGHQVTKELSVELDPLVFRGVLLGIEGVVLHLQRHDTFTVADRDRVAASVGPLLLGVLSSARRWGRRVPARD